jgi:hypothetical protein
VDEFDELVLVVEGRHHDVPSFVAFGVEPIVLHDESSNVVIVGVDPGHGYTVCRVAPGRSGASRSHAADRAISSAGERGDRLGN